MAISCLSGLSNLHQTLKKKRMQNQEYHQILQFSNHGIVATDENGLITFVNKRAKEILQFGRKKFVGTPIWKHMPKTGKLVADCLIL